MIRYMARMFVLAFSLMLYSCSNEQYKIDDLETYMSWLGDETNGLVKTKYINGIKLTLKYLSPEYLVYKDLPDFNTSTHSSITDSLIGVYSKTLSFMFSIGPDDREGEGIDITRRNVGNYKEYSERMYTMNFNMDNYVLLKTINNEFKPVLSSMENTYGLTQGRNIIMVFAPHSESQMSDFYNAGKLDFVYHDELFDTGINHFIFERSKIERASSILSIQI